MKSLYLIGIVHLLIFLATWGQQENPYHQIFPLTHFKNAVDTCIRSYSDALLLQDRMAVHEKYDELLDTLVGRLARLQSYIEQLIYGYSYEAIFSYDELEYLAQMLEYLEVTIAQNEHDPLSQALNAITRKLKLNLKQAITPVSNNIIRAQLPLYSFLPLRFLIRPVV